MLDIATYDVVQWHTSTDGRENAREVMKMSDKLTVRWEDPRIESMAIRGMEEEGFDTLSDYVRAAIVRDRFLAGDKEAIAIARGNFLKWWREKGYSKKIRLVLE